MILLPRTAAKEAAIVAERARRLIQLAGSPAPLRKTPEPGLWTTVSCGVATVLDVYSRQPHELLLAADNALYKAKAEGRNRICESQLLDDLQPVSS